MIPLCPRECACDVIFIFPSDEFESWRTHCDQQPLYKNTITYILVSKYI